ncbi:MAG: hypothetical protein QOJ27_1402 [Sphingomonadales bacterium]|nr:hypothetical protein [Sphingomonadales bacterium]
MSERQNDRIEDSVAAKARVEWARPEVDKLLTAGAEGTDGADVDAADLLS